VVLTGVALIWVMNPVRRAPHWIIHFVLEELTGRPAL
jgi:hypothetical protein